MKKIAIFSILLTVTFKIVGQVNVEYGDIFKNDKREIPTNIVGKDSTGYYFLYSEGKYGQGDDIFLRKFNTDLTPTKPRLNLKVDLEGTKFNSLGISKIDDKLMHLFSIKSKTFKEYHYQFIDISIFKARDKNLITLNPL